MRAVSDHENLIAWQKAMDLVEMTYVATQGYPAEERYGLVSQMRRAAVSIPSNIAEGHGRGGDVEFLRFLRIARGSLRELETQLVLSNRLGFLVAEKCQPIRQVADEVGRVVSGLIARVEQSSSNQIS